MERPFRPIRTSGDADLAFAVMVLAAYFTTFSFMQSAETFELLMMIGMGTAYIALGIYGYSFVVRLDRLPLNLVYFAIQLILGGSIIFLGKGVGFNVMVLLPLAGQSVVLLPGNWRAVINIGIVGAYALALNLFSSGNWSLIWSGLPMFLAGQIFIVVFTQMAVNEESARSDVEKLVKELEAANQRLREYAMQVEELAITKERNRLAREIHDGLGHYLTTVYMQIQAARAVMNQSPQKAQELLSTAQNLTQEALVDVRQSVASLRDMPATSMTLDEEIEKLLKGCEGSGIQPELKIIGSPRELSPQTILAIFRTTQEGINNTCKHSRARRLSVCLDYTQIDQVKLVLQDDGVGAEQLEGGFGLLGMRERVNMLNGEMQVRTEPGNGFRLEVCLPG